MTDKPLNQEIPANLKWVNRSWCATLEDMRSTLRHLCTDTSLRSSSGFFVPIATTLILMSLIEELQVYGNRMEAHCADLKEFREMQSEGKKLKAEIKKLREERDSLTAGNTECLS